MANINKIGVLTSGGDAPGMNAAIRAVVRTAIYEKIKVAGIYRGYEGLIEGDIKDMTSRSVSSIISRGGTILKSARCLEFQTKEGRAKAYENIKNAKIDALIVIGGEGSFTGAKIFSEEYEIPTMCIPGTIDNDLNGTDYTIGYDTANNTVIEYIDKIRDTAASHNRLFFIEVMGRDAGCIALNAGVAAGAEAILLPEKETAITELIDTLQVARHRNKTSMIVIVAEGDKNGGAYNVEKHVKQKFDYYDTKVSILGHLQRGGAPTSFDRILATKMGYHAVKEILKGSRNSTICMKNNNIITTPISESLNRDIFKLDEELMDIFKVMSI